MFGFGLIRDENKDKESFGSLKYNFHLDISNKIRIKEPWYSIIDIKKGDLMDLKKEFEFEVIICIKEGIFQISTLPNRNFEMSLTNETLE